MQAIVEQPQETNPQAPAKKVLFNRHPLAGTAYELRREYLAMVTRGLALDGSPSPAQCVAFHNFAASLGLDETEASRCINSIERFAKTDLLRCMKTISQYWWDWIYRMDLAWLQTVDGEPTLKMQFNMQRITDLLDNRDRYLMGSLHSFVLLLRDGEKQRILREMERMCLAAPPQNTWLCACAANMKKLDIPLSLPEDIDAQQLTIKWMAYYGQLIQAGEVIATIVKTTVPPQSVVQPLFPHRPQPKWYDESLLLPVQAPCAGILSEINFNLQNGAIIATMYCYPPVSCQLQLLPLEGKPDEGLGSSMFHGWGCGSWKKGWEPETPPKGARQHLRLCAPPKEERGDNE